MNLDTIYSQLIDESKRLKYTNTSSSRLNYESTKPSSNKTDNDIEMSNVAKKPFSKPSNTYNKSNSKAICEDVVGRGSEQYLLGRLSTIA